MENHTHKNLHWPELNYEKQGKTQETLHQMLQIVGKVRLRTMPWQNHSWHTTLYVSDTGYTTGPVPYQGKVFRIDFNFQEHELQFHCSENSRAGFPLGNGSIADFYRQVMQALEELGIQVRIHARPNEIEPAIPFEENTGDAPYDPEAAKHLWLAMRSANSVFNEFRGRFIGKCSPVHLFWGAFDLAVTRFSGRPAPLHQGAMPNMPQEVMQEAYSREVSSAGFWPGSSDFPVPIFYAYAYPEPKGFKTGKVSPDQAFYSDEMGEFMLKYEDVRRSENPSQALLDFLQSTYELAADLGNWDREALELQHYPFAHLRS